jgi:hypothetical protein
MKKSILLVVAVFYAAFLFGQSNSNTPSLPKGLFLEAAEKQRFEKFEKQSDDSKLKSTTIPVFSENFEGSTGFGISEDWQIGTPSSGPDEAYNGSAKCAATNLSGNYSNSSYSVLISPVITLPELSKAADQIVLSFYQWFIMESSYDYGYVSISVDGGSEWTQVDEVNGTNTTWSQNTIDLTTYAGKGIMIRFLFDSDGSVTRDGWFIDNVTVDYIEESPLTVTISSIDYQNFPIVFSNVFVQTIGLDNPVLNSSHFTIYEDGVRQQNFVEVIPPNTGSGSRVADIVFVLDVSGSMGDEIAAVKDNMISFCDGIEAAGIDYAVGFISYADIIYNYYDKNLITNRTQIINTINNIELEEHGIGDGGDAPENQLGAIAEATRFNFRPGSQKIVIMLTDAHAHESDDVTPWTVNTLITNRIQSNDVVVYPIFNTSNGDQMNQYVPIANASGIGRYFHVYDNFNAIINDITTAIGNQYIIRYMASNAVADGVEREVTIQADYLGYSANDRGTYTPGDKPELYKTEGTIDIESRGQLEDVPLTVSVLVVDEYEPYVNQVTIFLKNSDDDTYQSFEMTPAGDGIWEYTIPGSMVQFPGIDYYVTAQDEYSIATLPQYLPAENPSTISVLPNSRPQISHTPITQYGSQTSLNFTCTVTDNTNYVDFVILFIRRYGDIIYDAYSMANTSGDNYAYNFSLSEPGEDNYEYYIVASDDYNSTSSSGSFRTPHYISHEDSGPWEPVVYTNSTQMYCTIEIDGSAASDDDYLGAFVGGECRGVGEIIVSGGVAYSNMLVQGEVFEQVSFKIWDASEGVELNAGSNPSTVMTQPGGVVGTPPNYIEIMYPGFVDQNIELSNGWNLISFYLDVDGVNIEEVSGGAACGEITVKNLTQSWTNNPDVPAFLNTLTTFSNGMGYFVSAENACNITWQGTVVGSHDFDLSSGWNLVGYTYDVAQPVQQGYGVVIDNGKLDIVKNLTHSFNPDVPEFLNTLANINPGEGYFVKMNSAQSGFSYPDPVTGLSSPAPKSVATAKNAMWFPVAYQQSTIVYGEVTFDGKPLLDNALVGAFVKGECRATSELIHENGKSYVSLVVNGINKEEVEFRLLHDGETCKASESYVSDPGNASGKMVRIGFSNNASSVFPNPFSTSLHVRLNLTENEEAKLTISAVDGKIVKRDVVRFGDVNSGVYTWDGHNSSGIACEPGLYLISIEQNDRVTTHKVILNRN